MKHEKEWYTCDRCGETIAIVPEDTPKHGIFRRIITAKEYALFKAEPYCYLSDYVKPEMENCESTTVEGVFGYNRKIEKIHLCKECSKKFEEFMLNR